MAKKTKRQDPITNAVVAARVAGEVLQKCSAALMGIQGAMDLIDKHPDLDADQIRAMLQTCRPSIDEARAAVDWSE
jgi:hypothetical protein